MPISRGKFHRIAVIVGAVVLFAVISGMGAPAIPLNPIDQALGQVNAQAGDAIDRWIIHEGQDSGELWVVVHELDWDSNLTVVLTGSTGVLDLARSSSSSSTMVVHTAITVDGGPYTVIVKSQDKTPASYAIATFTSSAVSVVVLESSDQSHSDSASLVNNALSSLGINAQVVTSVDDFVSKLGNDPSLAIVCDYAGSTEAYTSALDDYLFDGGTCIVFDSTLAKDKSLLKLMDATVTDYRLFKPLVDLQNTTLFTLKNYLPIDIDLIAVEPLQAGADSFVAATIDGVLGDAGIVISHAGRAILNSFLPSDIADEDDASSLIENEIIYACLAGKVIQGWGAVPWWNRDDLSEGAAYVRQAKYVCASTLLRRAVLKLIPNSPWWDTSEFDFIPKDKAGIPQYLDKAHALMPFLALITDLSVVEAEFFNQVTPDIDQLKDLFIDVPPAVKNLRAWLPDFTTAMHRAEETGMGVFLLPPTPLFPRIYPSAITPLAQIELVNYTMQTQSLSLSASTTPPVITSTEYAYSISPHSTRRVSITPDLSSDSFTGPARVYLTLKVNGNPYYTVPLTFLTADEFPLGAENYAYLARWVTPNATAVADFSSAAVEPLQTASRKIPDEIARSLWDSLNASGFEYHDMLPSSTAWSQRIRTPEESLHDNGGNCIETSLLIASLLKSAGVDPYVVLIPSEEHAMAGWRAADGSLHFIEGTFLDGSTTFDLACLWGTKTWDQCAQSAVKIDTLSPVINNASAYLLDISALLKADKPGK